MGAQSRARNLAGDVRLLAFAPEILRQRLAAAYPSDAQGLGTGVLTA